MNAVVIRINILKKDEKLSNERNVWFPATEKADFGSPNWRTTKVKVITNPTSDMNGRNLLLLLNIKSKTTIATNVNAKDISGKIARRSEDKFGKINVITLLKIKMRLMNHK